VCLLRPWPALRSMPRLRAMTERDPLEVEALNRLRALLGLHGDGHPVYAVLLHACATIERLGAAAGADTSRAAQR
jgi:hypothetical protein